MRILGIETSCDETGVAIYDDKLGILANKIYSQINIHSNYGGVVPELASREHLSKIAPLIQSALDHAKLKIEDINGIAYTAGPGLSGPLIVGATIGRSLAYACKIPAIAIHHMEGHLFAPMLEKNPPTFPFLALLVSGGHTQLISVTNIGEYKLLGESIDDAVGEAFDKTAKLLGLRYPGGSELSNIARKGISGRYVFPRPMINRTGLDFSFSGLKTFAANVIRSCTNDDQTRADIARAFEDAIIDILVIKSQRALDQTGLCQMILSGGVSANKTLRARMDQMMHQRGGKMFYTRIEFCTDNGAMIAYVGLMRLKFGIYTNLKILIQPRWSLDELSSKRTKNIK